MSLLAAPAPICIRRTVAVQRAGSPNRLVLTLLIFAAIAAMMEIVTFQHGLETQVRLTADQLYGYRIVKPPLYYASYAIQLALSTCAAVIAICSTDFRKIERTYFLRLLLLFAAAILMMARSYSLSDLLSSKFVDATGPAPFFFFMLLFVGANRDNWPVLDKIFIVESVVLSCLVVLGITKLRIFSREEAVLFLGGYLDHLLWTAAWVVFRRYEPGSANRYLRFVPMIVFGIGSVFVQTRLNFVMLFALLVVYAYIQRKRHVPQAALWVAYTLLATWVCLFIAIFLRDSRAYQTFDNVANAFYSRLSEDTRTGQLYEFARDVEPGELLLGRGSFATWSWNGVIWNGGTDLGYLSLLLFGGAPLLLGYIAAAVLPSLRLFSRDIEDWQLAAAGVAFLFTIRMFSSSYPGQNLDSYTILLCTGACIWRDTVAPVRAWS